MVSSQGNGSGIKINFTSEVQDVLDGTAKVEDSLDDVGNKLDDVADTSRDATRKQTENLDDIKRQASDTYDEVGEQADKGFSKTAEAGTSAGQKIGAGLKDVVKDFDGSIESIGTGVTNTVSGIAAVIPGLGGFIGAALASIAGGLFATWNDNATKTEQRVKNMYDNLLEAGTNYETRAQLSKALNDFTRDPAKMAEAADAARILGQSVSDVSLAFVADGPQRDAAMTRLNELLDENAKKADAAATSNPRLAQSLANDAVPLNQLKDKLDGFNQSQDDAAYRAQINRRAQEDLNQTFTEQGAAITTIGDAIDELPHGKTVKIDADVSGVESALRGLPKILPLEARVFTRDGRRVY